MVAQETIKSTVTNKSVKGVNVPCQINTHFSKALNFITYGLGMRSQKYDGRISGIIAKWAKRMDENIKWANFKPSDPVSVLFFLLNCKIACDGNDICESEALYIFQNVLKVSGKAVP